MVDKQAKFDKLFNLLSLTKIQTELISECISMKNSILFFNCFDGNHKVEKEHILSIYKIRYRIEKERPSNQFVIGYEDLLPNLEKSKLEFINISSVMSEKGGFVVFSDYEYSVFVGILKSNRNLSGLKELQKSYEYNNKSTIFQNGRIK
ncbi:hypothetical protein WJN01_09750 [Flavobacteriaceae bacterium SZ-1-7]|uniref:hypothetical protein n=1 Tax=Tamlana sedimenti TaxID=3134126 RepID=UPI003127AEF4